MRTHLTLSIKDELAQMETILHDCVRAEVPLATEAARYTVGTGGKRLRAVVFLLSARLTGAPSETLPPIAAAFELMHAASLMHDDVVDDAPLRRGVPAARVRFGNRVSILVGDFLWSAATRLLIAHAPVRLFGVVGEALAATTEGALREIARQHDATLDRENYLAIVAGKTAALFEACGRGGAIAGEAREPFEEALANYGRALGMAFQLSDDLLDYTSCEDALGKAPGSDLREGWLTLPLIVAMREATDDEKRDIKAALMAESVSENDFQNIVAILERHGGIAATRACAADYVRTAIESLSVFKTSFERDALESLAEYVITRKE